MTERVVLAYSGGLDTSVAVRWLMENHGVEVVAVAVDVGQAADAGGEDWDSIRDRALAAGAIEATVIDARAEISRMVKRRKTRRADTTFSERKMPAYFPCSFRLRDSAVHPLTA